LAGEFKVALIRELFENFLRGEECRCHALLPHVRTKLIPEGTEPFWIVRELRGGACNPKVGSSIELHRAGSGGGNAQEHKSSAGVNDVLEGDGDARVKALRQPELQRLLLALFGGGVKSCTDNLVIAIADAPDDVTKVFTREARRIGEGGNQASDHCGVGVVLF
jgi:hypothetical protein